MPLILADPDEKQDLKNRFDFLKGNRGNWNTHWSDAARIASPRDDYFNIQRETGGQDLRRDQYDETAELILDKATSFFGAVTTPQNQRWHGLRASIPELNRIRDVSIYFDELVNILFNLRYSPRANFSTAKHEADRSLLGFGNGIMFTGSDFENFSGNLRRVPVPLWYRSVHLSQAYFTQNAMGFVDELYWHKIQITGRELISEYGKDQISAEILDQIDKTSGKLFDVVHAVVPNDDFEEESLNPDKMKFKSRHWIEGADQDHYLRKGGFNEFPYQVTRDSRTPTEQYGRGTLLKVLPAIKMRNQMKRITLRVGHLASDPPVLMQDNSAIDIADLRAGHGVVGGLNAQGEPMIAPWQSGTRWDINQERMAEEKQTLQEAFFVDLFLTAINEQGRERVTATEILARSQEQGRVLTPLVSRAETEGIGPQIERELAILGRAGVLPPMPPELVEAQGEFEIEFTNPLALMQRSDEAIGVQRLVDAVLLSAQAAPEVLDKIDWDEYAEIIGRSQGVPEVVLRSDEDVAAIREQRAEQLAVQGAAENAAGVGRGILDATKAEQLATTGADAG